MIEEALEFRISQYADGTLPAAEAAALEAELASNADAQAMLEEYRQLDAALKREMPLPAVKWDLLADRISDAVAERDRSNFTIRLFGWGRTAVAAAILVCVAGALWTLIRPQTREQVVVNPSTSTAPALVAISEIAGPAAQSATEPAIEEIAIGPSPQAQQQVVAYAAEESILYRAPRVVIASTPMQRQDMAALPF